MYLIEQCTYLEQLPNKARSITKVLLDQLGANNAQERGRCLICNGFCQQSLSSTGCAVEDHALGWFDTHLLV